MQKHLITACYMSCQSLPGCFCLRPLPQGKESAKFLVHPCPTAGCLPLSKTHLVHLTATLGGRFSVSFSSNMDTANYLPVCQMLCISTCKLHFLSERRSQAAGQGKEWWESAPCAPREKGVARVDEGGPDLKRGVTGMPGKASKTQKSGSLYMGEALSSLQRGKEGAGKAEVR